MTDELKGFRGTPGEWAVVPYGDGDSLVIHADEETRVCFMATPGGGLGDHLRISANGRLIAQSYQLALLAQELADFEVSIHALTKMADLKNKAATLLASVIGE